MWSTPSTVASTAASIKKFYRSMLAHGLISREEFDELKDDIKENLPDWKESCRDFNDPDFYIDEYGFF